MTAGRKRICCCSSVPLFSPSNYFLGSAREERREREEIKQNGLFACLSWKRRGDPRKHTVFLLSVEI